MKDTHYYTVLGWMGRRLGLRGNDLICFAIIYGFSQDGESQFKGTVDCLCDWMFCSRPTALLCLAHLINLDLISKEDVMVNGKKRCYYATKVLFDNGELQCLDTSKEPLPNTSKEPLPNSSKEPLPYNNSYNNNNKKEECNKLPSSKKSGSNSRFVKPTIEQIDAYIQEKGYHFDAEHFWNYYESKGWKVGNSPMKNWKAACATWESKRKSDNLIKSEEQQNVDEEDRKLWEKQKEWLEKNLPNIAPEITQDIMLEMRHISLCDRYILQDTLEELNKVYDGGDIIQKFREVMR